MNLGIALFFCGWTLKFLASQYLSTVFPDDLLLEFIENCDLVSIRKLLEVSKGMGELADSVKLRKYYRPVRGPNGERYLNWNAILNLYPDMSKEDKALFPSLYDDPEINTTFFDVFTNEITFFKTTSVTIVMSLMKDNLISALPYVFKRLPVYEFRKVVATAASFSLIDDITITLMDENKALITADLCNTIAAIRGKGQLLSFCIDHIHDDEAKQALRNVPVRLTPDFSILGDYLHDEIPFCPYDLIDTVELMINLGSDHIETTNFLTISLESAHSFIELNQIMEFFEKSRCVPGAVPLFHEYFTKMFESNPDQAASMIVAEVSKLARPENHETARLLAKLTTPEILSVNNSVVFFLAHETDVSVIANFWIPLFFETGHHGLAHELIACFSQFSCHDHLTIGAINMHRNKIEPRVLSEIATRRRSGELFTVCNEIKMKVWNQYFADEEESMDEAEVKGADAVDLDYWMYEDNYLKDRLFEFLLRYFLNCNASAQQIVQLVIKFFKILNHATLHDIIFNFRVHQTHPNLPIIAVALDKIIAELINCARGTEYEQAFFSSLCSATHMKVDDKRNFFYDSIIDQFYFNYEPVKIFEFAVETKNIFMIYLLREYNDSKTFGQFLRRLVNEEPKFLIESLTSDKGKNYREIILDNIPDNSTFEKLFVLAIEADVDFEFIRLLSTKKFFIFSIKNLVSTRRVSLEKLIEIHRNQNGIDIIVSHVIKRMIELKYSEEILASLLAHFERPVLHTFVPIQTVLASREYSDHLVNIFMVRALEKKRLAALLLKGIRLFNIKRSQFCIDSLGSFL